MALIKIASIVLKNVLLLFFGLFILCETLYAQGERLAAFNAVRIDRNNIEIRWTMKAGVSCESPQVERSADGSNFQNIYTYPGVCGGGQTEESFKWIDTDPLLDRASYYRLKIDEGEFSRVEFVDLDLILGGGDIRLFPNPASEQLIINYLPELGRVESVDLFEISGNKVMDISSKGISASRGKLSLNVQYERRGLYILQLTFDSGSKREEKVLLTH